jgi:hypothetical protein
VLAQAWSITRRSRSLQGLGAISAAQVVMYSLVVMLMVLPSFALPQLLAPLQAASGANAPEAAQLASVSSAALSFGRAVASHLPAIVTGIVLVMAAWVASGIFDVAAQAGSVVVVSEELAGGSRSLRESMRSGFGVWWQAIGLLAVAALPALVLVLALGLTTLFTYSIPLMRGQVPSPAVSMSWQAVLAPLQSVASIVSVVLGVVVQVSMRFVALEHATWRRALRDGWAMTRAHVADIALLYVLSAGIGAAVLLAMSVISTIACLLIAGVVGGVLLALHASTAVVLTAVGIVLAVVGGAGLFVCDAGLLAWYSAAWTVLWSRLRHNGTLGAVVAAAPARGTHTNNEQSVLGQH